jgi:serine/threonine-protein kinase
MRLLAKAPEERYQDASSAAAAIAGAMRGIQGFLERHDSDPPPPGPPRRSFAALPEVPAHVERPESARRAGKLETWLGVARTWTRARQVGALAGALIALIALGFVAISLGLKLAKPKARVVPASASVALAVSAPTPAGSTPEGDASDAPSEPPPEPDPKAKFLSRASSAPSDAARVWLLMFEADPKALDDPEVQKKTAGLLVRSDPDDESIKSVFDQLTHRAGAVGLDVLYRVLDEEPGSRAAERAAQILYRPGSAERASPALRVTLDIRRMNCTRKLERFDRAGQQGDERTARELEKLRPPSCTVRKGQCCFKDDAKLEKTLAQIRSRKHDPGGSAEP